ncbi:1-acyl-sn-glycerol-3-phosphate acyltransferase [Rhodobacterales bacterium 59_46_T64]|nr:1-acyl-sn-glycerol-3-phosphate acyltransferase [Rhodobacterales bacterium 59_46_T64]
MSDLWHPENEPEPIKITWLGWILVLLRGGALLVLLLGGLMILLALRLAERPIYGLHRPWTPWITQMVCRAGLAIFGIRHRIHGERMNLRGAIVANHTTWLDIFALNARKRIYFVSKSEVAGWPGIGWLARATGTVFITRDRKHAKQQQDVFESRLLAGHKLLFFPEGTSTDGMRVLPFKSTLFQAFFTEELRDHLYVQPVSVVYRAPKGRDARFYGWWGDMEFGPHMLQTLAAPRQGSVDVHYHRPLKVSDFSDRKALAAACETAVRAGMPPERQIV